MSYSYNYPIPAVTADCIVITKEAKPRVHHLGMTFDPICGLVQIPCIERNAFAASRAADATFYAISSEGNHRISFDHVVEVMKRTGHDLPSLYKETSEGGLALEYKE